MLNRLRESKVSLALVSIVFESAFILILLAIGSPFSSLNIADVFIGIAASLLAWLLVYILMISLDKYAIEHQKKTEEILDVLKERYISLVSSDRSQLKNEDYDKLYREGNCINISGIALRKFTKYLTSSDGKYLIDLIHKERKEVRVLLLHPDAAMAKLRQGLAIGTYESIDVDRNIIRDINKTKNMLTEFYNAHLATKENPCGSLTIKMTKNIFYSTIFHVNNQNIKEGIMQMGLIFSHQEGDKSSLYTVPRFQGDKMTQNPVYSECLEQFNFLFNDSQAEVIFSWR